jgi:hypothetical protein
MSATLGRNTIESYSKGLYNNVQISGNNGNPIPTDAPCP